MYIFQIASSICGLCVIPWFIGSLVNELRLRLDPEEKSQLGTLVYALCILLFILGAPISLFSFSIQSLINSRSEVRLNSKWQEKFDALVSHQEELLRRVYSDGYSAAEQKYAHLRSRPAKFVALLRQFPVFSQIPYYDFINNPRITSALDDRISYSGRVSMTFEIKGATGNLYTTTLQSCTCPDFQRTHQPCKHMIHIATDVGLLSTLNEKNVENAINALAAERAQLEKERKKTTLSIQRLRDLQKHLSIAPISGASRFLYNSDVSTPMFSAAAERRSLLRYLTKDELALFSEPDIYQIALDRFRARKLTRPQLGAAFERYIGSLIERSGYYVQYNGIESGKGDMGRDLIALSADGKKAIIVQCKCWASDKIIHENVVMQLYGNVALFSASYPQFSVSGCLVCTCAVSDDARKSLNAFSSIKCIEHFDARPMSDYSIVKCIYDPERHTKYFYLPFDRGYDSVPVIAKNGSFYAKSVSDIMLVGFERPIIKK